jgi:uncharacterized protein YecE (DUF72 family)
LKTKGEILVSEFRIGISGWRYAPWRKQFYPVGLPQKSELYFASRAVNSIEINGSFYALQTPARYQGWYDDTPGDFIFSVKASRFITHIRRLKDVEHPIANFFASGLLNLRKKLGPILWQFPPSFKFDGALFEEFLQLLPHTTKEATESVRKYHPDFDPPQKRASCLRHCVEIRNKSFMDSAFIDLLKKFDVALVIADSARRWPYLEEITSDFVYMRLHGDAELYRSGYSDAALQRWFERMQLWAEGKQPADAMRIVDSSSSNSNTSQSSSTKESKSRDIFCYFDNTDKLWAPYDARKILAKLDLVKSLPAEPGKLLDDAKQ